MPLWRICHFAAVRAVIHRCNFMFKSQEHPCILHVQLITNMRYTANQHVYSTSDTYIFHIVSSRDICKLVNGFLEKERKEEGRKWRRRLEPGRRKILECIADALILCFTGSTTAPTLSTYRSRFITASRSQEECFTRIFMQSFGHYCYFKERPDYNPGRAVCGLRKWRLPWSCWSLASPVTSCTKNLGWHSRKFKRA